MPKTATGLNACNFKTNYNVHAQCQSTVWENASASNKQPKWIILDLGVDTRESIVLVVFRTLAEFRTLIEWTQNVTLISTLDYLWWQNPIHNFKRLLHVRWSRKLSFYRRSKLRCDLNPGLFCWRKYQILCNIAYKGSASTAFVTEAAGRVCLKFWSIFQLSVHYLSMQ